MGIITDILKDIPLSALLKERLTELEKKHESLEAENATLHAENARLKEQVAKEVGTMELTWAGKIEKKGREQGRLDGARSVLIRLLEHRFGPLPGRVRNRVEKLDDPQELELLSEQLLDAGSLADLGLST